MTAEPGAGIDGSPPAPAAPADNMRGNTAASNNRRTGDRRVGDRRRADRRSGDRRGLERRTADGGAATDADAFGDNRESIFDPSWLLGGAAADAGDEGDDGHGRARRAAAVQDTALARVYRTYAAARAMVGLVLVVVQVASSLLGARLLLPSALLCSVYAVQAIALWLLPRFRKFILPQAQPQPGRRRLQWLATIGVDLLVFGGLHVLELGSSFNFAALLVLPVLMAGVLASRLLALATAAGVTLMLLGLAWRASLHGGDINALGLQAGLAGLGLFVITLLAGELAGRLAREELAARGSLELARQQAQLNRLVIEEMVDGVLVVDHRLRVRAANPAARVLLAEQGLAPSAPFPLGSRQAWLPLSQAIEEALSGPGHWPEAGRDIALLFERGHRRTLRVRVRFMRRRVAPDGDRTEHPFCVLLLEDVRTAEARLRQEKLAAMGRVSAGIAHEIRNPLAAIAQANALLLEDAQDGTQQRLARIVADNVERLKRIVDDVMEVAPGAQPVPGVIDATAEVGAAAAEWARTVGLPLGAGSRLQVELPAQPLGVSFDPEHLRRVLVNLLDNAHRHASPEPAAVVLRLMVQDEATVRLAIASDSPPIPPEVERHLFEPFFSTRSRGTGLGLYICRELCERYGAHIEYRAGPGSERWRNEFRVVMQRASFNPTSAPLGLVP